MNEQLPLLLNLDGVVVGATTTTLTPDGCSARVDRACPAGSMATGVLGLPEASVAIVARVSEQRRIGDDCFELQLEFGRPPGEAYYEHLRAPAARPGEPADERRAEARLPAILRARCELVGGIGSRTILGALCCLSRSGCQVLTTQPLARTGARLVVHLELEPGHYTRIVCRCAWARPAESGSGGRMGLSFERVPSAELLARIEELSGAPASLAS